MILAHVKILTLPLLVRAKYSRDKTLHICTVTRSYLQINQGSKISEKKKLIKKVAAIGNSEVAIYIRLVYPAARNSLTVSLVVSLSSVISIGTEKITFVFR